MKFIKPDHQAVLTRNLHWQGRDLLSVGLVALFDLKTPALDALRAEADLWKLWPQATGTPPMLDEVYPKPRAEFMAYGDACAPQGRAVAELVVSAQVGEVRKSLLVHGERRWNALGLASAAKPFVQLPLVPAHAFGGPDFTVNPLGQGVDEQLLPQIEDPRHPVAHPSDRPEPAGFWGVDASAPRRQKALGATDAAWLRTQWPALPQDTQTEFFQSAPADQRGAAAWRGDELIALQHWSAEQPQIESRLPGLRARCFAQRLTPQGETVFEEMPAHAETVWLLPGLGCGAVLYRATLTLNDPDALDVTHLVADWEALDSAPLDAKVYQARLHPQAEAVPVDAPAIEPASTIPAALPEVAGAVATAAAAGAAVLAVAHGAAKPPSPLQPLMDKVLQGQPLTDADARALASASPEDAPEVSDAHIQALTKQMLDQRDALLAEHGLSESDVAEFLKERGASAEAIQLGGMTRAQMEAQFNPPTAAAAVAGASAVAALPAVPAAPAISSLQPLMDKVLAGEPLTEADVRALASAAPEDAPQVSDAHLKAMTTQMLDQRDALLAEHGLSESDVAVFLKGSGASAEAIQLGGMTRSAMEAHFSPATPALVAVSAAQTVPAATAAAGVAAPKVSPLQPLMDKVLLGQPLTDADVKALSSAAPEDAPHISDAHLQAMTTQMLNQRDALLAEHELSAADVAAFLKERGASAEAIQLGGMTRAEMEAHFGTVGATAAGLAAATAAGAAAVAPVSAPVPDPVAAQRASVGHTVDLSAGAGGPAAASASLASTSATASSAAPGAAAASVSGAATGHAPAAAAAVASGVSAVSASGKLAAAPARAVEAPKAGAPSDLPAAEPKVWTREAVEAHHAQAGSFKGENLSGLDLSKLDLSGADFSEATLEKTLFSGSRLAGARFDRAQMPQADLSGVDADHASFAQARAASAVLVGAKLPGAVLDAADFSQADFSGASLTAASCARTDFQRARLGGLSAEGLRAPQALFDAADLAGADLRQAALEGARLNETQLAGAQLSGVQGARSEWFGVQAAGVDFKGAQLPQVRGGSGAVFAQADFTGANLTCAVWDGVDLQGASLRGAQVAGADFSASNAAGMQLEGADARGANFSRAQLAGARMAQTNLMGASLRRADLAQASLTGSNLHGADLEAVRMDRSDLRGALITGTVLAIEGRPETRGMVA